MSRKGDRGLGPYIPHRAQCVTRDGCFVPRMGFGPDDNRVLVALADERDSIARGCPCEGFADRRCAVDDAAIMLVLAPMLLLLRTIRDFAQDCHLVLEARILVREDREIGVPGGDCALHWSLGRVPLARAAEDD